MKHVVKGLLLLSACALGACASNSYCEGDQAYQKAKTLPPLAGVEGLKVPESASALKIPPAPPNAVAYGTHVKNEKGKDVLQCLDKPPDMPPPAAPAPKPEEKKPA
jgi:uncharacterized lipoprotein